MQSANQKGIMSGLNVQELPMAMDQLMIDEDDDGDRMSYSSEIASYAATMATKATDYRFHHGRRYHAYEDGKYMFPNDEKEVDRLDVMHQMLTMSLGRRLFTAPVENPKRILDIGTGTGIWAMEVGDKFPNASVLGNDLSQIQPRWVLPNVQFEVDDIEKEWAFAEKFDFIHARALYGAIKDWPMLVKRVFDNLEPGGYCEFYDLDILLDSPDNTLADDSPFRIFNSNFIDAARKSGIEPTPGPHLEKWVRESGFEDVKVQKMELPIGTWPADEAKKEIGAWNYMQVNEGLEGFIAYIFTTRLGWSVEAVHELCARVRIQMQDRSMHAQYYAYNVVGRKPLSS